MSIHIDDIMDIAVQAGTLVLENGGETYRAEETCVRIAKALGANNASAFVTPTVLIVSILDKDRHGHTTMNRITNRSVNLRKIAQINDLSRRLAKRGKAVDPRVVERLLARIRTAPDHSFFGLALMGGFAGFFFALMFGCSFLQALCAFVIGLLLRIMLLVLEKSGLNTFILSALSGGLVSALCEIFFVLHLVPDSMEIMTAALMQVVPGLAIVNAIRDLISGDLMSGTARLVEAFMIAAGLSIGSIFGVLVFSHVII